MVRRDYLRDRKKGVSGELSYLQVPKSEATGIVRRFFGSADNSLGRGSA